MIDQCGWKLLCSFYWKNLTFICILKCWPWLQDSSSDQDKNIEGCFITNIPIKSKSKKLARRQRNERRPQRVDAPSNGVTTLEMFVVPTRGYEHVVFAPDTTKDAMYFTNTVYQLTACTTTQSRKQAPTTMSEFKDQRSVEPTCPVQNYITVTPVIQPWKPSTGWPRPREQRGHCWQHFVSDHIERVRR